MVRSRGGNLPAATAWAADPKARTRPRTAVAADRAAADVADRKRTAAESAAGRRDAAPDSGRVVDRRGGGRGPGSAMVVDRAAGGRGPGEPVVRGPGGRSGATRARTVGGRGPGGPGGSARTRAIGRSGGVSAAVRVDRGGRGGREAAARRRRRTSDRARRPVPAASRPHRPDRAADASKRSPRRPPPRRQSGRCGSAAAFGTVCPATKHLMRQDFEYVAIVEFDDVEALKRIPPAPGTRALQVGTSASRRQRRSPTTTTWWTPTTGPSCWPEARSRTTCGARASGRVPARPVRGRTPR